MDVFFYSVLGVIAGFLTKKVIKLFIMYIY